MNGRNRFAEVPALESRRSELSGVDPVALHLEMQSLVIDPEESRRFTLIPSRRLQGQTDRLALRFRGGPARDLFQ